MIQTQYPAHSKHSVIPATGSGEGFDTDLRDLYWWSGIVLIDKDAAVNLKPAAAVPVAATS